jgi:hypothetical protein
MSRVIKESGCAILGAVLRHQANVCLCAQCQLLAGSPPYARSLRCVERYAPRDTD